MDIANKVKLGANGVKTRDIYEYSLSEVTQARKEVSDFLKFTGVNIPLEMSRPEGKAAIHDMIWERLEKNRRTPEEYKAEQDALRKAGRERAVALKAEADKKKAERKAIEDAKPKAVKEKERKIEAYQDAIDRYESQLKDVKDEADYDIITTRIEELKEELAKIK